MEVCKSALPRQNSAVVHVEQTVDIPVPGRAGGGGRGGLQSSLPRQNSAAVHVEQTVDIPVPGRAGGGGGGLQGSTGQGSTASSSHVGAADDAGQGVFRTLPRMKKSAKRGPHSGSELGCGLYSIHAERSSNASGAARGCASAPGSWEVFLRSGDTPSS